MASPRVLLVDDDVNVLGTLGTLIAERGYAVLIAANGNDGLGKARNKRPDVVVSHLMMPCDGRHDIRRRLGVRPSVTRYSGAPQFCRRGAAARCVCQRVSKDGQEGRTGY